MKRMKLIGAFFLVAGLIFCGRLLYLQVFCHTALAAKADAQEFHSVELATSARGAIVDRAGRAVTAPGETMALLVVPALVQDDAIPLLAAAFDLSAAKLTAHICGVNGKGEAIRKTPFFAKEDLSGTELERAAALELNGVFVVPRQGRYRRDLPALHLLGAVAKEGDGTVGLSGLERVYDGVLAADSVKTLRFLTDSHGKAVYPGEYFISGETTATAGSVALTLDLDIQRAVEAALGDRAGAAVVLDSANGDVLAMASSPKYDPARTKDEADGDIYVNKALAAYPPASLFKVFLAAVALERGIVTADSAFFCNGGFTLSGGETVSCWRKDGHGVLAFGDALGQSCNPIFVATALDLGEAVLKSEFSRWELDDDRLVGYPRSPRSHLDLTGGEGALANVALGEDGVMMTPLNVAKMFNTIAAGGVSRPPRLVTTVKDADGAVLRSYGESLSLPLLSKETAATLTQMMKATFATGTAASLGLSEFEIAGKTGTSETGNVWIGGFFPASAPRYTVVVLINGGVSGSADGGPVMKAICAYLAAK